METNNETQKKFDELFKLPKIERRDLAVLNAFEKAQFKQVIDHKMDALAGEALDDFMEQIKALTDPEVIWEWHQNKIERYMESYNLKYGSLPQVTTISQETRLSRPTVTKHLNNLAGNQLDKQQTAMINLMLPKVIGRVLTNALKGDMRAAKIYIDAAQKQKAVQESVNQHNYVQINNTVINQQVIQLLKPEQLELIEQMVRSAAQLKAPDDGVKG